MDGFYYDLQSFGEELKNIRKSLRLSQSDVSKHGFILIEMHSEKLECVKNNTLSGLRLLYFRKAIAEYHLGKEEYKDSLSKSLHLLEITGQEKLIKMIMESCRKSYNLELSKENNILVIKSHR